MNKALAGLALALTVALTEAWAGIGDLRFMCGAWRGTQGGSVIEETWMEPEGDGMVGMARVVSGGKTRQTEIGLVEQRAENVVLLLRHFGRGQVAREEKEAPLLFVLKDLVRRRAEFVEERTGTRLVYERTAEDRLTVTLIKTVNGKEVRAPFEYRRR
ncbi:MAG TPA: DUF6265 family protein [Paludibaculum sp.]|jgi:hypothetical protein